LIKKNSIWTWRIEQQNVLEMLKKTFIIAPVLKVPNNENAFKLFTDTSKFATGAVLLQKIYDKEKPAIILELKGYYY